MSIVTNMNVSALTSDGTTLECIYSGKTRELACQCFIPVTSREPNDQLYKDLKSASLKSLVMIGDCNAPGIIAQAVYEGHKAAREWAVDAGSLTYRRERAMVGAM